MAGLGRAIAHARVPKTDRAPRPRERAAPRAPPRSAAGVFAAPLLHLFEGVTEPCILQCELFREAAASAAAVSQSRACERASLPLLSLSPFTVRTLSRPASFSTSSAPSPCATRHPSRPRALISPAPRPRLRHPLVVALGVQLARSPSSTHRTPTLLVHARADPPARASRRRASARLASIRRAAAGHADPPRARQGLLPQGAFTLTRAFCALPLTGFAARSTLSPSSPSLTPPPPVRRPDPHPPRPAPTLAPRPRGVTTRRAASPSPTGPSLSRASAAVAGAGARRARSAFRSTRRSRRSRR